MKGGAEQMVKQKRVVIITGPGFEEAEVIAPLYRLREISVVDIVTSNDSEVKGKHGYPLMPTVTISSLRVPAYNAVIIPGGHEAPDRVRQVKALLAFVRGMHQAGKLVSSICHGPWVLISSDVVKGRKATCYLGMKDDLVNAGAKYQNAPVVIDQNLITSDHPKNIAVWMKATVAWLER